MISNNRINEFWNAGEIDISFEFHTKNGNFLRKFLYNLPYGTRNSELPVKSRNLKTNVWGNQNSTVYLQK